MPSNKEQRNAGGRSSFRVIIFGFLGLILLGTLLLCLPIATRTRVGAPFGDALFTAVSATCVTGLVVQNTAAYWSGFGQGVILALIQIGGMGVITVALALMAVSGKKIGLRQRSIMQDSIASPELGGIVPFTAFILKMSAVIELAGAALLAPVFCRQYGFWKGLWYAVFHSISAFCNAGFDLTPAAAASSLSSYSANAYLNIVVMLLIVTGGIGFLVWRDIGKNKYRLRRYSLQSKLVLFTTLLLIVLPALFFFLREYAALPTGERVLSALFQSVTARTAGFNTQDLSQMGEGGSVVMIGLMLIGGSPGSTAGGMKTTTVAVLLLAAVAVFGRKNDVQCFRRRLAEETVRNAGAILFIYLFLFMTGGLVISAVEGLPLLTCLFETASAVGTVGLSLGVTATLSTVSRVILMVLMFFGRVGGLTLIYAAVASAQNGNARLPLEKITIG